MFIGMFAPQPNYEIFLRSFFAKKRPPASLTRLLRNQLCPQAHRHFSFCELFLFVPLVSKRKSGLTVWVALLQRFCKAQTDTPLSFDTKGAKESSQRKRRLERFARCDERQGLASPLTCAHWRGGSYGLQCEHRALNYSLAEFYNRHPKYISKTLMSAGFTPLILDA